MNRAEPKSHSHTPPPEYQADDGEYSRRENGLVSRKCPACGRWIGLGPKGGAWSFQQHVNSNSCAKERKKKELEAVRPTSKATNVFTPHPLPFMAPASLAPALPQQYIPSAFHLLANSSPSPHLATPSLRPSWSAPSSPQICSAPSYTHSHVALPSLALEPKWLPQVPTIPPPARKGCPGSLILWEPGDPATTYPFTLHSRNLKDSTPLPWTVELGERPGSLRLRSDECRGVSGPSQSCCQPCAGITSSTKYQQVEDHAKHDHKHRAYDKLNFEQLATRTHEKSSLLTKERSKVGFLGSPMYALASDKLFQGSVIGPPDPDPLTKVK